MARADGELSRQDRRGGVARSRRSGRRAARPSCSEAAMRALAGQAMMRLMFSRRTTTRALALFLFLAAPAWAQTPQRQTQEDDYTRYELLGPDTAQFRILYEVTATTPGAKFFFNAIRKGSVASDER